MTEYYNSMLSEGIQYQEFVTDQLYKLYGWKIKNYNTFKEQIEIGENSVGFEIKYDKKFNSTGNLWIECKERTHIYKDYVESGIFRKDNTWLIFQGDYNRIFIFSKFQLQFESKRRQHRENRMKTSIGFLLPIKEAEHLILHTIIINEAIP